MSKKKVFDGYEDSVEVELKKSSDMMACPKCQNTTKFQLRVKQVGAECFQHWVRCQCGFAPGDERVEFRFVAKSDLMLPEHVLKFINDSWFKSVRAHHKGVLQKFADIAMGRKNA
ncbi:hypothetical protein D3C87_465910 [compost metagenome]